MAKRHPLEVFRDSQKQSTTRKDAPEQGSGLGAFFESLSGRRPKEDSSKTESNGPTRRKKSPKNRSTEESFLERSAALINRGAGKLSKSNSAKASGGGTSKGSSKKDKRGAPGALSEYRPLLLLAAGAILALLSAGFVGYKVGFHSGLDSANSGSGSLSDAEAGFSNSPRLSSEWRDPSLGQSSPEIALGQDFIPFRVLVRSFWIDADAPEVALGVAELWRQSLEEDGSGFDNLLIAKSEAEGAYNLYCGLANQPGDLDDLLGRIKALKGEFVEGGPVALIFEKTARIVQDDLR